MEYKTTKTYLDTIPFETRGRAVALGYFDGVHEGHAELIRKMVKAAKQMGIRSTVQTFTGFTRKDEKCLTTIEEKLAILSDLGVDEMLVIRFDEDFRNTSAEDFYTNILRNTLNSKVLFAGDDYRFGKDAAGDPSTLRQYASSDGIAVKIVPQITLEGYDRRISSTWMREALAEGDVGIISRMCGGRPFSYSGRVIEGKKLGRQLGFPTINLIVPSEKAVARRGVYVSRITIGSRVLFGVSNIGRRPTVDDDGEDILETYIFDFDEDVYGASVKVDLLSFLRPEEKFPSKEELVSAIEENKKQAKKYLSDSGIIV